MLNIKRSGIPLYDFDQGMALICSLLAIIIYIWGDMVTFPTVFIKVSQLCDIEQLGRHLLEEANVLFNDALSTYGVRHIVKNHSNSERGNPLLPHLLLFPI